MFVSSRKTDHLMREYRSGNDDLIVLVPTELVIACEIADF